MREYSKDRIENNNEVKKLDQSDSIRFQDIPHRPIAENR